MSGTTETYSYQAGNVPGAPAVLIRPNADGTASYIPLHLDNPDYQAFLAWVAAGNVPPSGWTGPKNP